MRSLIRIILIILGILLVLLLAYLLWLALQAHWPVILFFGFLTVGILLATTGLVGGIKQLRSTTQGRFILAMTDVEGSKARQIAVRALIFGAVASGGWLYTQIREIFTLLFTHKTRSFVQQAAHITSKGLYKKWAMIPLPLLILCLIITHSAPRAYFYGHLFSILILMNIISRLLLYAIASPSLPIRLRRELGSALTSFIIIAIFDLMGIIAAFYLILYVPTSEGSFVDLVTLQAIASSLFFVHILDIGRDLITARDPNLSHLIMSIVGVLYSFTILESAYRFHEFRRSDEDHISIGNTYNLLGRYTDALKTLDKVKSRTSPLLYCRATAHLGVNQYDRAWTDVQQALRQEGESESSERIFYLLYCLAVTNSLGLAARTMLIERGVVSAMADVIVAFGIFSLTELEGIDEEGLRKLGERIFSDPDTAGRYPLSRSTLSLAIGDRVEGKEILRNILPQTSAEHIYGSFLDVLLNVTDPITTVEKDIEYFDEWSTQNVGKLIEWAASETDPIFRSLVLGEFLTIYQLATKYESQYQQSWLFNLNEIKKMIVADPSIKLGAEAADRFLGSLQTSLGVG